MLIPPREIPLDPRCAFRTRNGRRCRMLRAMDHPTMCTAHGRRTLPENFERSRDVVVVAPPTVRQVNAMLNQCMIWWMSGWVPMAMCDQLCKCVNRVQRCDPQAAFELSELWRRMCDVASATEQEQEIAEELAAEQTITVEATHA